MNEIANMIANAIVSPRKCPTAIVLDKNENEFAEYSTEICVDVAEDIGGYVMDKATGEVTYISSEIRLNEKREANNNDDMDVHRMQYKDAFC